MVCSSNIDHLIEKGDLTGAVLRASEGRHDGHT